MSNIYIQEPPTSGKVCLKTTVGDIDIELWSKECPKACKNFIQHCMNEYYNGTIFHRVVPGFIAQGGDPTASGLGGESIYGEPFKDEFHSRLRFSHRGIVAMANGGPHDNGSQFFFTLDQTPDLQGKHTIFGKVVGNTLFNMLKLGEGEIDKNERPLYPHKIIKAEVLNNPFPDVVPQIVEKRDRKSEKEKSDLKAEKNLTLLSFGDEAEEEEDINQAYSGKTRSAHDVQQNSDLSEEPAVMREELYFKAPADEDDEEAQQKRLDEQERMKKRVAEKLRGAKGIKKVEKPGKDEEEDLDNLLFAEKRKEGQAKMESLKAEYKQLQKEMVKSAKRDRSKLDQEDSAMNEESAEGKEKKGEEKNVLLAAVDAEREKYANRQSQMPSRKSEDRQKATMAMLEKFKEKLNTVKQKRTSTGDQEEPVDKAEQKDPAGSGKPTNYLDNDDEDADFPDDDWMAHKFEGSANEQLAAKDANVKSVDSFDIYDPRNPMTKRRREKGQTSSGGGGGHRRRQGKDEDDQEDDMGAAKRSRHDRR